MSENENQGERRDMDVFRYILIRELTCVHFLSESWEVCLCMRVCAYLAPCERRVGRTILKIHRGTTY